MAIPFFGGLLGFFGGFAFAPTTYYVSKLKNYLLWLLLYCLYMHLKDQIANFLSMLLCQASMHHVACPLQTETIQSILVYKLGKLCWSCLYVLLLILYALYICLLLFFFFSFVYTFQMCIILGVTLMVVAPIGALRTIIVSAKTYKFFS